jgi:hypothetical protein
MRNSLAPPEAGLHGSAAISTHVEIAFIESGHLPCQLEYIGAEAHYDIL